MWNDAVFKRAREIQETANDYAKKEDEAEHTFVLATDTALICFPTGPCTYIVHTLALNYYMVTHLLPKYIPYRYMDP